jgi:hypothetical protein
MDEPFISVCLIVRDEEATLQRCLESFRDVADELIVVDTGSRDRSIEIARSAGARLERFEWCDDFSAARNYACSFAKGRWIMMPDGDELLRGAGASTIVGLLEQVPDDVVNILVENRTIVDGAVAAVALTDRLFRNRPEIRWRYRVHEVLDTAGGRTAMTRDFYLHHEPGAKRDEAMRVSQERIELYLRALSLDVEEQPDDPRPLYYLASTLNGAARYAEAQEAYERYFERSEGREPARRAAAFRDAAAVAGRLDDEQRQRALLFRSLEQDWRPAETYAALAELALHHGNRGEAIHWLTVSTTCSPPQDAAYSLDDAYGAAPWRRLAALHRQAGDEQAARRCEATADELDRSQSRPRRQSDHDKKKPEKKSRRKRRKR